MKIPLRRHLLTAAAVAALFPASAPAQDVQGIRIRVVDSASTAPLRGALIALIDADNEVVAEALSLETGSRYFPVAAGRYRVRVRRIGYRPHLTQPITVPRAAELVVAVPANPVTLTSIVISARSRCQRLTSGSGELASVWDEATKALQASRLTMQDLRSVGQAWKYRKTTTLGGGVITADTTRFMVTNPRAFRALEPAELARAGYVRGDPASGWDFYGPDETVLLSPTFAATHCFKLVRNPDDEGLIGVSFEPVPGRRVSDISGTVWIDRRTNELRNIRFKYVNAGYFSQFGGSGETKFTRLASGAWIVSDWHLRGPILRQDSTIVRADGYVVDGGGVIPPSDSARRRNQ